MRQALLGSLLLICSMAMAKEPWVPVQVKDALFIVKDDIASHLPEPMVQIADPLFKDRKRWAFIDDTLIAEGGKLTSSSTKKDACFSQRVKLAPFRQYHVRVEIRTEDLTAGRPEIKVLAGPLHLLRTTLTVQPTQDWTVYDTTFNSLDNTDVQLTIGIWGGHEGTVSYRKPMLDEVGLIHVLNRPETPFIVRTEDGKILREGHDYEPIATSERFAVEQLTWHMPLTLQMKSIEDGTRLRVSYYHPRIHHED